MEWYYAANNQRQGPVGAAEFEKLVADGVVKPETLVWRPGMVDWQPYSVAAGGAAPAITAERYDAGIQRMPYDIAQPSASVVPGPYGYGGFWRRFVARLVDGLLLGIVGMMMGGIVAVVIGTTTVMERPVMYQIIMQLISMAIGITYEVVFIRKFDATLGKMALGVRLLRSDGSKLSVGRIIGRYLATILSALPLLIGYIIAAFDEEKRTLHDRICDTRVVKTR